MLLFIVASFLLHSSFTFSVKFALPFSTAITLWFLPVTPSFALGFERYLSESHTHDTCPLSAIVGLKKFKPSFLSESLSLSIAAVYLSFDLEVEGPIVIMYLWALDS